MKCTTTSKRWLRLPGVKLLAAAMVLVALLSSSAHATPPDSPLLTLLTRANDLSLSQAQHDQALADLVQLLRAAIQQTDKRMQLYTDYEQHQADVNAAISLLSLHVLEHRIAAGLQGERQAAYQQANAGFIRPHYTNQALFVLRQLYRLKIDRTDGLVFLIEHDHLMGLIEHSSSGSVRYQSFYALLDVARGKFDSKNPNWLLARARTQIARLLSNRPLFTRLAYEIDHSSMRSLMQRQVRVVSQWAMRRNLPIFTLAQQKQLQIRPDVALTPDEVTKLHTELLYQWGAMVGIMSAATDTEPVVSPIEQAPLLQAILFENGDTAETEATSAMLDDATEADDNAQSSEDAAVSEIKEALELLVRLTGSNRAKFLQQYDTNHRLAKRAEAIFSYLAEGDRLQKRLQQVRSRITAHAALLRIIREARFGLLGLPAATNQALASLDQHLQPQWQAGELVPGYYADVIRDSKHSDAAATILAVRQEAALEASQASGTANRRLLLELVVDNTLINHVRDAVLNLQLPRALLEQAAAAIIDVLEREVLLLEGVGPNIPKPGEKKHRSSEKSSPTRLTDKDSLSRSESVIDASRLRLVSSSIGRQLERLRLELRSIDTPAITALKARLQGTLQDATQMRRQSDASTEPSLGLGRRTEAGAVIDFENIGELVTAVNRIRAAAKIPAPVVPAPVAPAPQVLAPTVATPNIEAPTETPTPPAFNPADTTQPLETLSFVELLDVVIYHQHADVRQAALKHISGLIKNVELCRQHRAAILQRLPRLQALIDDGSQTTRFRSHLIATVLYWHDLLATGELEQYIKRLFIDDGAVAMQLLLSPPSHGSHAVLLQALVWMEGFDSLQIKQYRLVALGRLMQANYFSRAARQKDAAAVAYFCSWLLPSSIDKEVAKLLHAQRTAIYDMALAASPRNASALIQIFNEVDAAIKLNVPPFGIRLANIFTHLTANGNSLLQKWQDLVGDTLYGSAEEFRLILKSGYLEAAYQETTLTDRQRLVVVNVILYPRSSLDGFLRSKPDLTVHRNQAVLAHYRTLAEATHATLENEFRTGNLAKLLSDIYRRHQGRESLDLEIRLSAFACLLHLLHVAQGSAYRTEYMRIVSPLWAAPTLIADAITWLLEDRHTDLLSQHGFMHLEALCKQYQYLASQTPIATAALADVETAIELFYAEPRLKPWFIAVAKSSTPIDTIIAKIDRQQQEHLTQAQQDAEAAARVQAEELAQLQALIDEEEAQRKAAAHDAVAKTPDVASAPQMPAPEVLAPTVSEPTTSESSEITTLPDLAKMSLPELMDLAIDASRQYALSVREAVISQIKHRVEIDIEGCRRFDAAISQRAAGFIALARARSGKRNLSLEGRYSVLSSFIFWVGNEIALPQLINLTTPAQNMLQTILLEAQKKGETPIAAVASMLVLHLVNAQSRATSSDWADATNAKTALALIDYTDQRQQRPSLLYYYAKSVSSTHPPLSQALVHFGISSVLPRLILHRHLILPTDQKVDVQAAIKGYTLTLERFLDDRSFNLRFANSAKFYNNHATARSLLTSFIWQAFLGGLIPVSQGSLATALAAADPQTRAIVTQPPVDISIFALLKVLRQLNFAQLPEPQMEYERLRLSMVHSLEIMVREMSSLTLQDLQLQLESGNPVEMALAMSAATTFIADEPVKSQPLLDAILSQQPRLFFEALTRSDLTETDRQGLAEALLRLTLALQQRNHDQAAALQQQLVEAYQHETWRPFVAQALVNLAPAKIHEAIAAAARTAPLQLTATVQAHRRPAALDEVQVARGPDKSQMATTPETTSLHRLLSMVTLISSEIYPEHHLKAIAEIERRSQLLEISEDDKIGITKYGTKFFELAFNTKLPESARAQVLFSCCRWLNKAWTRKLGTEFGMRFLASETSSSLTAVEMGLYQAQSDIMRAAWLEYWVCVDHIIIAQLMKAPQAVPDKAKDAWERTGAAVTKYPLEEWILHATEPSLNLAAAKAWETLGRYDGVIDNLRSRLPALLEQVDFADMNARLGMRTTLAIANLLSSPFTEEEMSPAAVAKWVHLITTNVIVLLIPPDKLTTDSDGEALASIASLLSFAERHLTADRQAEFQLLLYLVNRQSLGVISNTPVNLLLGARYNPTGCLFDSIAALTLNLARNSGANPEADPEDLQKWRRQLAHAIMQNPGLATAKLGNLDAPVRAMLGDLLPPPIHASKHVEIEQLTKCIHTYQRLMQSIIAILQTSGFEAHADLHKNLAPILGTFMPIHVGITRIITDAKKSAYLWPWTIRQLGLNPAQVAAFIDMSLALTEGATAIDDLHHRLLAWRASMIQDSEYDSHLTVVDRVAAYLDCMKVLGAPSELRPTPITAVQVGLVGPSLQRFIDSSDGKNTMQLTMARSLTELMQALPKMDMIPPSLLGGH